MASERKVIVYIAASLDGYIAGPDNSMEFLSIVNEEGQDYGYFSFIESVDTAIMGRKTYDWVMTQVDEFPHAAMDSFIITRTPRPSKGKLKYYSGELKTLILKLKSEEGKHIFIDGGAEIVNQLLKENLIDEIIVSVIPILLGNGVRLFQDGRPEQGIQLLEAKSFPKGLVQLHYKVDLT
jgi:dihydrofolate reductase